MGQMEAPVQVLQAAAAGCSRPEPEAVAMRMIAVPFLVLLPLAGIAHAYAEPATRYLELINRAHDSIVSLAIAAEGSDAFRDLPVDAPLQGGGHATTLAISGEVCRYDIRISFRDGRSLLYKGVDICRYRGLRVRSP